MARYPIGNQDFCKIRENGWVYVDKTRLVYELTHHADYVFLSRPRRFGKSLLLSTIRYYLEGRKELFEGLEIEGLEKEWRKHPVLHLELSRINSQDQNSLSATLDNQFAEWEKEYDIEDNSHLEFAQRFANIIKRAHAKTGEKIVILIDEYDNPLINTIYNREIYETNRNLLKAVYSNLKAMDKFIRFAMLTGVSRFSKMTIFSGINNLTDITFDDEYSAICGFTLEEIKRYLMEGVGKVAEYEECDTEKALKLLKEEYDGYHFSLSLVDIYNPFSLLNCLQKGRIDNYWMQSGVPEFLVKRIKDSSIPYRKLFAASGTTESLAASDAAFDSPVALLYQTGYLTIKSYDRKNRRFMLGMPNKEVDEGLFSYLLKGYYSYDLYEAEDRLKEIAGYIERGDPESFLERLRSLLAGIPYHLQGKMTELDFERTLFVIFHVLGYHVHSEMATSSGRIDLLIETKQYIYIVEIKLDKTANQAQDQIIEKEYALAYEYDGRKVFRIGVNFSSETRNITDWIVRS